MEKRRVFVGTYTEDILFGTGAVLKGRGEGIYVLSMDAGGGSLELIHVVTDVVNPSFLCLTRDRRFLYAVNEMKRFAGRDSGAASAFAMDREPFFPRFLNQMPTGGTDPCHVVLDAAESHVLVANFMSGSVVVFPRRPDGGLGEASHLVQHRGAGPDPRRQAGPHAHSLTFEPGGDRAFVPDLGLDKLMLYRFSPETGKLLPADPPWIQTHPGGGPRHFEFHPGGRHAYLINELSSSLVVFRRLAGGGLEEVQTVSTIPDAAGENICADVHLAPSGKFLYASNRGHDSLAIYRVDPEAGLLSLLGFEKTGGRTPRNFGIDPSGRFLIVANQDSDNLVVFAMNPDTGGLSRRLDFALPTPVCVKFA